MKLYTTFFVSGAAVLTLMAATIDLNDLFDYEGLEAPNYITQDNTPNSNVITNEGATLGRVLFYDKKLSINNTIACASCHKQSMGFSDDAIQSEGYNGGVTGRHSMRLINARYAEENHFFWDERATSAEDQASKPIQDEVEMGFSGQNGDPDLDSLISKLEAVEYYPALFEAAFGDESITETRIQQALAQFVRSIQSFDSKFDEGMAQTGNINANFPNFTAEENTGKNLFIAPPPAGAGCQGCHRAPEFDIDPATLNNGVIGVAGSASETDLTNTKAPSLRDVVDPDGNPNGPFMHDGSLATLEAVIDHYNHITINPINTNLDPRLAGPNSQGQNLNLSQADKDALVAFLKTLSGEEVYTAEQWSDPFDANGEIDFAGLGIASEVEQSSIKAYPNPVLNELYVSFPNQQFDVRIYDVQGKLLLDQSGLSDLANLSVVDLPAGLVILEVSSITSDHREVKRMLKL